jgi:alcohol dehydrogenase
MRYNLPVCVEKMADIGEIVLGKRTGSAEATARAGIERLEAFFADLDIATRLQDIVGDDAVLPQICEMAAQDACLLTNPREATVDDMVDLCKTCW